MSDSSHTRRNFIKCSVSRSLLAVNAGIVVGLINTPGLAGAVANGPVTTQPQTTEGLSTFPVASLKTSNGQNINITVSNADLISDPAGTNAWVANQLYQQLSGQQGLIFVTDLRSNWKSPTGMYFPSISAGSMNFPYIGNPPPSGTTVFNFSGPITVVKALLVPKDGPFPLSLLEDVP